MHTPSPPTSPRIDFHGPAAPALFPDDPALPVLILLAAGRGERYAASGGATHKLVAPLGGRRVIDHTLAAVQASGLRHHVVQPDATRPGMGDSIAAGVRATVGAPGWLVLPGDLPLVQPQTLRRLAEAPWGEGQGVMLPLCQGQRGHPVRFARECGPALMALSGPQGAAAVLRGRGLCEWPVDDLGCITDIDTVADLARAEAMLAARWAR